MSIIAFEQFLFLKETHFLTRGRKTIPPPPQFFLHDVLWWGCYRVLNCGWLLPLASPPFSFIVSSPLFTTSSLLVPFWNKTFWSKTDLTRLGNFQRKILFFVLKTLLNITNCVIVWIHSCCKYYLNNSEKSVGVKSWKGP